MTRPLAAVLGVALIAALAAAPSSPARGDALMTTDEKPGTKLSSSSSAGAAPSDDDEREATRNFNEGNAALNNGLLAEAVDKYSAALAHWDHPAIHFNLALALINLDRPLEVHDHLVKAMAFGADPLDKDKYDHAREYLRLVDGQIGDVEVSCEQPGARVVVDGKEVFVAPGRYTAKVRVGIHSLLADKPGYLARTVSPFIGPGKTVRVELTLYTTDELTRYRRRWDRAWLPYTVIGAGALVALGGGGIELLAGSDFRQYDAAVARCNADSGNAGCSVTTPGIRTMRDSGMFKQTTGYVMYGVGGAAMVVGGVLAYMNRRESYQIRPEELHGTGVSLTPVVAPGGVGALVQVHF